MVIPADAPHPNNAYKFIDYILRPEVHASLTNKVFYANPNKESRKFIKPEVASNPTVFPGPEDMKKMQAPDALSNDIRRTGVHTTRPLPRASSDGPVTWARPLRIREPADQGRGEGTSAAVPSRSTTSRSTSPRARSSPLLGSSGCGKTTLLRMLAGFETPTSGRIVLDGRDLAGLPPYERPINMMFQSYALFPHLTVWENIAFGLKRDGMPADQVAQRVEAMLAGAARHGQAQAAPALRRPAAARGAGRSLAKRPQLLLLDEPLGALDKKLREETQIELVNIIEEVGVTCVMVTHDQEEAMTMARDRHHERGPRCCRWARRPTSTRRRRRASSPTSSATST